MRSSFHLTLQVLQLISCECSIVIFQFFRIFSLVLQHLLVCQAFGIRLIVAAEYFVLLEVFLTYEPINQL